MISVGYVYPSFPNAPIGSLVTVSDTTSILINLQSGAAISSAINASTEWNITITSNTPSAGIDQVTYTWNGTGTAPALTLSGGEYVNITTGTEFSPANDGVFRVSTQSGFTPTATHLPFKDRTDRSCCTNEHSYPGKRCNHFLRCFPNYGQPDFGICECKFFSVFHGFFANQEATGTGVIVLSTFEDSGFTSR